MRRLLPALMVTLVLAGCDTSGKKKLPVFPVTGKVTLDGKPCIGAAIIFHPKESTDPHLTRPVGTVQQDGSLVVSTYTEGDGAPAGTYILTVTWMDPDGPDMGVEKLPERYGSLDPKVSGLPEFEVKPQSDNTLTLALKK